MPAFVGPVAMEEMACSAVDTLLALMRHRKQCPQCPIDESFCKTALSYQSMFLKDVESYRRAKEGIR